MATLAIMGLSKSPKKWIEDASSKGDSEGIVQEGKEEDLLTTVKSRNLNRAGLS